MYIDLYIESTSFIANLLHDSLHFYSVYFMRTVLHSLRAYQRRRLFPANLHLLLVFSTEFDLTLLSSQSSASSAVLFCSLFSLVNTIAQAVSCCSHFVADHGAESLLPSNCHSVHFMLHIPSSPFVRLPLASRLFF